MSAMERLDKILSEAGFCSRRDSARLVRRGLVTVDGMVAASASDKVDDKASVEVDGVAVVRRRRMVCIMNKPKGFVTSTDDPLSRTVMELLPEEFLKQGIVPVGRLDKDTEGLLLFTNDGDLLHRLISPRSEISKTYLVEHDGVITDTAVEIARKGVVLKDGTVCRSAEIERHEDGVSTITITEGMYHQVKRMFAALGCHVIGLKRLSVGNLELGDIKPGEVRELADKEISLLSD